MNVAIRAIECFIQAVFFGLLPFVMGYVLGLIMSKEKRRKNKMENECKDCKYYDPEENVCKACGCWPIIDCDDPLPCEKKKERKNDPGME